MRIVRKSTFETNSSSAHSLTFKREDKKVVPNYQGKELILDLSEYSNKFAGEPDTPEIYTDFESRLAYLLCSAFSYFSYPTNIRVEVPVDYVDYLKDLAEDYKRDGFAHDFLTDIKEENGRWSDNFKVFSIDWYGSIFMNGLVSFLKEKVKIESLKIKVHEEEYCYNEDWSNRQNTKIIKYGTEGIFSVRGLEYFGNYKLDYPIPLPLLYNLDWVESFLFSKSTQVCISSTINPLNIKLIPDWDNKKDGYSLYPDDRTNIHLINLVKDYNVVYNSCQLTIDEKGYANFGVGNNPFRG